MEADATLLRGVNGECDPAARVIRLARGLSDDCRARTFCQEFAHAWPHDIGGDRAQHEAEADGVAYVVATWAGLDCDGYSFGYVAGWAENAGGAPDDRRGAPERLSARRRGPPGSPPPSLPGSFHAK